MMRRYEKQFAWFLLSCFLVMSSPLGVLATEAPDADIMQDLSEDITQDVLEDTTQDAEEGVAQDIAEDVAQDMNEEATQSAVDDTAQNVQTENRTRCVYDDAGLLTETEILELEDQIATFKEVSKWEVFAITTMDSQGKTTKEYADDFFDNNTSLDADGFVAVIDMDNREYYISTCGETLRYLEDTRVEAILDDAYYYIAEGDYAGCLSAMVAGAEYYFEQGIHRDQYNYDVETGVKSEYRALTWGEAVPVLLLAAGVGIGIYVIVVKSYHSNGKKHNYEYLRYGTLNLTKSEDRFIRQNVIHHRIQTNHGGGSHGGGGGHRTSTHRSSGGRSHGGGGRKF